MRTSIVWSLHLKSCLHTLMKTLQPSMPTSRKLGTNIGCFMCRTTARRVLSKLFRTEPMVDLYTILVGMIPSHKPAKHRTYGNVSGKIDGYSCTIATGNLNIISDSARRLILFISKILGI